MAIRARKISTVAWAAMALMLLPAGRAFADITINNGSISFNNNAEFRTSTITINAGGTLNGGSSKISVSGNWANSGAFNAGTSTVAFENSAATSAVTGSNTFYSLVSAAAGKTINFAAGLTQTVNNLFSVTGAPGSLVILRSSVGGNKWSISFPNSPQTVNYVDLKDSDALLNTAHALNSVNSGNNNANWDFAVYSARSGPWSDPATWNSGAVPTAADAVVVSTGHVVIIDTMTAVSSTTTIYGTLQASRVVSSSWTLVGGNVNVNSGGTLDYGTETDVISPAVNAQLVLASGTYTGQYGLIVNDGGNFTVRGSAKTPYAFATASISAAATSLTVYGSTSVAGWQAGDVITVGPTSGYGTITTSTRTITSIDNADPVYTINWTGSLGTERVLSSTSPIMVGNLTRNVLVRSSGTVVSGTAGNSAYIRNLARNATSFALIYGEFAYLTSSTSTMRSGIIFSGSGTQGSISSSTVRNCFRGLYLDASSGNTLTGNNFYSNGNYNIYLATSANNILAGNNFYAGGTGAYLVSSPGNVFTGNNIYSHGNYGVYLTSSPGNTFTSNNSYSNYYGFSFDASSANTLAGNNAYSNGADGIYIKSFSGNNTLSGNKSYGNSGYGIYLYQSSSNTLTGNSSYSNTLIGILLNYSSSNTLTGNIFYSNSATGVRFGYASNNNALTGNVVYSNDYGIYLSDSNSNTLTGNNSYSNSNPGLALVNSSDNILIGNRSYSNVYDGIYLSISKRNTLIDNQSYSNTRYGINYMLSSSNTFVAGNIGYNDAGASLKNAAAEIYFDPGSPTMPETLVLKGVRVNTAGVSVSTAGMDVPGASLISYNQDADTGTVRLWGNYLLAGSTMALDHSARLYASTATAPRLMRGTGHSLSSVVANDAAALTELITVKHIGGGSWTVTGSSSGVLGTFTQGVPGDYDFAHSKVSFRLTVGNELNAGDTLDFATIAASNDANVRKKLLFGPSASTFNKGHSKLEVDTTGGVVLRGKTDGTANTLIDWLGAGSTYYTFVDSGAFTAVYSSFTNMDQGGIQLSGSADVAISSSTFDYLGFAAGTNAYITARGLASNAVISNVSFALSRSSAGYSAYNVWVEGTDSSLNWTLSNPAGALWGEKFDGDPGNNIAWTDCRPVASAQPGLWSAASTWDLDFVPTSCNAVTVVAGHTVVLDTMTAVSSTATINGTLAVSRVVSSSWTLVGGDINVNAGGTLDYGTEDNTIPDNLIAHLVLASGTYAGQYGLIVNNGGNFTVRGSTKTPYAFASASIGASDTSLTVYGSTSVVGWQVGDAISIGPTPGTAIADRVIASIGAGPNYVIGWSGAPLGQARILSSTSPIIVANLTRNVLVRSSGTAISSNSAYISNRAQNAVSFTLAYGEFAYLGGNMIGGIRFNDALTKGSISSSTIRNGYHGIDFNRSSGNTLIGNNILANSHYGIYVYSASNNTLTGNNFYANSYGVYVHSATNNTLTGNNVYSNSNAGIELSGSNNTFIKNNNSYLNAIGVEINGDNNTIVDNNSYSNSFSGISLWGTSNNIVVGNNTYLNVEGGLNHFSSSNNTLIGNNSYSNLYGVSSDQSFNNIFIDGNIGYNSVGNSVKNTAGEIYFMPGTPATPETLILKGTRVNPIVGISAAGMNVAGASLISYNQDADTGTVRIWGNYQLAGSTLALDYAQQIYVSTNTTPKLMRGAGHIITNVVTSDSYTLSELITVKHTGGNLWTITGSSSGVLGTFTRGSSGYYDFVNNKVNFRLTAGSTLNVDDTLDFAAIAASNDANVQKKLLFGPAASTLNKGHSKLEVASTGGLVLRGNPNGTANTLVDWLGAGSTYYTFVDSGAFTAAYSSFTNMDQGGIQLSGTAGVAISSSTFDYLGFASGSNAYITMRSLTSNAAFYNITFGVSRSSAGYAPVYNVLVEGSDISLAPVFHKTAAPLGPLWGENYNYDPGAKIAWVDEMPPAAITDLASVVRSTGSVLLAWTAPGDDGVLGILNNSTFTIQYTSTSADAQNPVFWATAAAQVNISTMGITPGTSVAYVLGGLAANTSYYYRLWAKDAAGNYSALSNGTTATTLIEAPSAIYFDEVSSNSITASGYAASPAFSGLSTGLSGVAVAMDNAYQAWRSGDNWAVKAGMPTPRYLLAAAVLGGKVYAIGGRSSIPKNANEEYDPVANTWTTKAVMPTARYSLAAAASGGKVYAIGGSTTTAVNINEEYDPVQNTWATKTAMPTTRYAPAAAAVGGKIYVLGGFNGWLKTNEAYEPATDSWTTRAQIPEYRMYAAAAVVGGKIYAIGGRDTIGVTGLNQEYNPVTNSWLTKAAMPTARTTVGAAVIGGKIYAIAGENNAGVYYNANEEYDPVANSWVTRAAIPTVRCGVASVAVGGRLYGMGGSPNYSVGMSTNEVYDPGVAATFGALAPNTQHFFKAMARNAAGVETAESLTVSTFTLAVVPSTATPAFTNVYAGSVTVNWTPDANPAGTIYYVQLSTTAAFSTVSSSGTTSSQQFASVNLLANTTYYARVAAINGSGIMTDYQALGSTITLVETPAGIFFDEVTTNSITASAYAAAPAFSGLENGLSGVAVAISNAYQSWRNGNTWATKTAMPAARRSMAAGAIGGKLYVVGGYNSGPLAANGEYDPAANAWADKTAMPTPRYDLAAGVISGRLYAVGGTTDGSTPLAVTEEYDPVADTWATKAVMPTARTNFAAGVTGGRLYAVGGYNASSLKVNEEYDPISNTWAARAAMPTSRNSLAAGVIGGRLYAVGGYNGSPLGVNEEYDPAADTWSTRMAMPTARNNPAAGAIGGKLYAVGGNTQSLFFNTVEEYDPAGNVWRTKTPMPTARYGIAAGTIGGRLYAIGGTPDGLNLMSANEEYDPGVASSFTVLSPNTQYSFKAKARNAIGAESAESPVVSTFTLALPLGAANVSKVYFTSATLTWTAIAGNNGYSVRASSAAGGAVLTATTSNGGANSLVVAGMLSYTTYYFQVGTLNGDGVGNFITAGNAQTPGITSTRTGLWSDPYTWDSETVPTARDAVTIAAGHTVTLDTMTAVSSTATINGVVKASRMVSSSWTLVGGDITVNAGGTLDYGTEADVIPSAVNAQLVLAYGATAGQYGLIVNNGGNFTVRGSTKTPYAFASASIGASDTSLTVYGSTSVTGWQPGDVITVGPTSGRGPSTTASRTITSVTGGPVYTVGWSGGALGTGRTLTAGTPIIVGNLTRNVLVRSSGTAVGTNTSYILNLAQNTTSFALAYGEFAYLGKSGTDGKQGITFNDALTKGSISSSTVRNGYHGLYLNASSSNTLTANNFCSNLNMGVFFQGGSHNNTLTGNSFYSNSGGGIKFNGPSVRNNTLTGNNFYSNANKGIYFYWSPNNTLAGNNAYSNSGDGIYLQSSSNNNLLAGNNAYSNSNGIELYGPSDITLTGNNVYSNSNYGIYAQSSSGNTFVDGSIGYNAAGDSLKNAGSEIYFEPGTPAAPETLVLKNARVNTEVGISTAGMDVAGASLVSFNQNADTGTVRIWGDYQLAGSTATLDYAQRLYASANTAPKLMRGAGHTITNVVTNDAATLSELITVQHTGGDYWTVTGSSSGVLGTFYRPISGYYDFTHSKVNFRLTVGPKLDADDMLDFVAIAASNDADTQKKLLFGPAAATFNKGRSRLEVSSTGGIVLRGKDDGTAPTLVDWLGGGSTYYTFVDSGAFTAEHSSFTNMDQNGIQLSGTAGAVISSSTFDFMGLAAGTNTYITARGLTSGATFYNVAFERSRSCSGYTCYNVSVAGSDSGLAPVFRKTVTSLGQLWGEFNDYDPSAKVSWIDETLYVDCGYRIFDGTETWSIACEPPGAVASPLRIGRDGSTYGIWLAPVGDINATKQRVNTTSGVKALRKF